MASYSFFCLLLLPVCKVVGQLSRRQETILVLSLFLFFFNVGFRFEIRKKGGKEEKKRRNGKS